MRKGFLASLVSLFVGSSVVIGQSPTATLPAPTTEPAATADAAAAPKPFWDGQADPGPGTIWSADFEYVLWFFATHGNPNVAAATNVLGPAATIVLGSNRDEPGRTGLTSGARLTLGYWWTEPNVFVPNHYIKDVGGEVSFFFVGQRSAAFNDGNMPNLVRPFFDLNDRAESAVVVAAPGLSTGTLSITTKADMWGAEANARKNVYYNFPGTTISLDLLAGFRYLSLDQDLQFNQTSIFQNNLNAFPAFQFLAGSRLTGEDLFTTHNRFYGGQFGLDAKFYYEKITFDMGVKLALGETVEDLTVSGFQLKTAANGTSTLSQGNLLALPTNIGHYHKDKFAQMPDLTFKLAYPMLDCLTLSAGVDALYWNRFMRPGEQIDRQIDITQIPNFPVPAGTTPTGLFRPSVPFTQSQLWVLGITLGVEVTW
jgi:hypothetical protein